MVKRGHAGGFLYRMAQELEEEAAVVEPDAIDVEGPGVETRRSEKCVSMCASDDFSREGPLVDRASERMWYGILNDQASSRKSIRDMKAASVVGGAMIVNLRGSMMEKS